MEVKSSQAGKAEGLEVRDPEQAFIDDHTQKTGFVNHRYGMVIKEERRYRESPASATEDDGLGLLN